MLILTDFSEGAFRAAEYACGLTGPLQISRVVLYHAFQTVVGGAEIPVVQDGQQIYLESMQELGLVHDRIRPLIDSTITIDLMAEDAYLSERINTLCEEQSIDIMAIGVAGKSGLEKLLVGSTTTQIQRTSAYPLLIVPEEALIGGALATVVFTTDLQDLPVRQANRLMEILNAFRPELHVVNVRYEGEERRAAEDDADLSALRSTFAQYDPKFHFIEGDDTAAQILAFSQLHNASMIVAVHRKHGFLSGLFHRSVAGKLAHNARIPVLNLPGFDP
ncbi:universal stress protein [Dyadobacter sp. BHUBP1]|uniref:universal stress protein n=1 Tax=Dyadobacter sp. BHUBP1 TaxID=3424178 RepID=UPI003D32F62B